MVAALASAASLGRQWSGRLGLGAETRSGSYPRDPLGRSGRLFEGDRVIWERYRRGLRQDEPMRIFSGSKSFLCAAAMAAETDGLLDLEQPASRLLTEWQDDPNKATITGRQLLNQTSGLEVVFPDAAVDAMRPFPRIEDQQAWAIAQPVASPPGERFEYGCVHTLAAAALIESAVGEPVVAYLEHRVFEPIGLEYGSWTHDSSDHALFSVGAAISARDWARYGRLLRDDGAWEGEPILPPGSLVACFEGSEPNPAYGLAMWLNRPLEPALVERLPGSFAGSPPEAALLPGGPEDLVAALGWRHNRMYIIPSQDLVIVRLGRWQGDYRDYEFLALLLGML
jgi:CubicO group peptidase (beta-lactamase class C family)